MKRILVVCLLGIGMVMSVNQSKAAIINHRKIIDHHIEGWTLSISSDEKSGELIRVFIYDANGFHIATHYCSGYTCTININELSAGLYYLKIEAAHQTKKIQFYKAE